MYRTQSLVVVFKKIHVTVCFMSGTTSRQSTALLKAEAILFNFA